MKMLKFNKSENRTFFILQKDKVPGMEYGTIMVNHYQLSDLIECIDILLFAYPIPRNLRIRVQFQLLPRFNEIQNVINSQSSIKDLINIEISKLNQLDILYALNSTSIRKLLDAKGIKSQTLRELIDSVEFSKF
ncbi:MAG: hypothetical protein BAJALOKI1v1_1210004 [Promethearchaeota archaeon]|nr:MAG: hypothetical protein BAJALOKI1v1_1210004 [Candidatus Lokiarchaeota archaeon]